MAGKTVMAFGAFDGVHTGHDYYLREAKKLGGRLFVSVARDHAKWKAEWHYDLPEAERMLYVKSLGLADKVFLGSETDALARVKELKPDVVALTDYHPVDEKRLEKMLSGLGLKTKVVKLKAYKPEIYDYIYASNMPLSQLQLMGLPPSKKWAVD